MKNIPIFFFCVLVGNQLLAQNGKISVEAHYGMQIYFFDRTYEETQVSSLGGKAFYTKNTIGSMGGAEVSVRLGKKSSIGFTYSRSVNGNAVSYSYKPNPSSPNIVFTDFTLRDVNQYFQLFYSFDLKKRKSVFSIQPGLFYVLNSYQEIDLFPTFVSIDERNFKNSGMEEGGVFLGLAYSRKIDTKFSLGIKTRLYYTASVEEIRALSLTPSLTYHF